MEIKLDGKVAFITASSKGIGFGVAKVMAECGADVILLSRNEENLRRAAGIIKNETGRDASYIVADMSREEDLKKMAEKIEDEDVSIFFFSTGGPKPGYFMEVGEDDWKFAVSILLYPAIYITRSILPGMIERKWGRIIYSTSTAIKEIIPAIALSNVVRISMAGLIRTLAKEVGGHGITVNGIMPGIIKTERIDKLAENISKREGITKGEAMRRIVSPIPAGRMGLPEEIGYLAAFLSSDFASYINGAIIPVDGGKLNSTL